MVKKLEQTAILQLAELLAGKRIDTVVVQQGVEFICKMGGFDCGLVYEIDQYTYFNLKEQYISGGMPLCKGFATEEIRAEYRAFLAKKGISHISHSADLSANEQALLDIFSAGSMAVVALPDEKLRIAGMLVFVNAEAQGIPPDAALKSVTTLLSMLGRYVETRMYQNKLSFARASLASILDNAGIDVYVNDFYSHEILYSNKSMAAPYGGVKAIMGKKCWQVLFPGKTEPCEFCPQKKLIDEEGKPTRLYTWDYQRPFDGAWFRVFSSTFRWMDGRLAHVVSSANITENKRNEALIQYMAYFDPLTKLPNRRKLIDDCDQRINKDGSGGKGYLLFFDIDGFKAINDTWGHDAGDEFLVKLGEFFSTIPMLKDAIYRNGGDEFVAILHGEVSDDHVRSLARFLHSRFTQPWALKDASVFCNVSIGVASYPEDGTTAKVLLHQADQAMYHAKKSGGGRVCFAREL